MTDEEKTKETKISLEKIAYTVIHLGLIKDIRDEDINKETVKLASMIMNRDPDCRIAEEHLPDLWVLEQYQRYYEAAKIALAKYRVK
jgi:hypothetical protein